MAGTIEMPAHMPDHKSVELYLRERGLSAFKDRLFEYGVETVADLLDQEIVTDHALVNDIFMTAKDIEALHAPPQVGRELDYSHLSTNRMASLDAHHKGMHSHGVDHPHDQHAEFCGFSRRLKHGAHCKLLSSTGGKLNTVLLMLPGNDGIEFIHNHVRTELKFTNMARVTDLAPGRDICPHKSLDEALGKDAPDMSLMLSFKDPEQEPLANGDMYLGAKYEAAAAALSLAKYHAAADDVPTTLESPPSPLPPPRSMSPPLSPRIRRNIFGSRTSSSIAQAAAGRGFGPTVVADGWAILVLTCSTVAQKDWLKKGFDIAGEHAHRACYDESLHKAAHQRSSKSSLMSMDLNSPAGNALASLHHLYRPHHHHSHPPARFHNGIEVEVTYDEAFQIVAEFNDESHVIKMPCKVYNKHMYLRARIVSYDRESETYDLQYCDGPYMPHEEPDGHVAFRMSSNPTATYFLRGVPSHCITVDMSDNYGSHFPAFLLLASVVQTACFLYYAYGVWGDNDSEGVSADLPVSGPEAWWMKTIGPFESGCHDLRYQAWRLWSYQLVHAGYGHLTGNMFMQIIFGLPINMVHGNIRFFIMYELGVVGGALCFVLIGGGQGALVGCSGGVYAIFGIQIAELLMNWGNENRGFLNHWTRLLIMSTILGLDFYGYYAARSGSTSYTAHVGGFLMGLVIGILTLENLEVTCFERWFITPFSICVAVVLLAWSVHTYAAHFPPEAQIWDPKYDTCCVQLLNCQEDTNLRQSEFSAFECKGKFDDSGEYFYELREQDSGVVLETCNEVLEYRDSIYGY